MALVEAPLLRDIFQNNIDYVAKQIQTFNDFLFGVSENEDGSNIAVVQPLYFQGTSGFACTFEFLIDTSSWGYAPYTNCKAFGIQDCYIFNDQFGVGVPSYVGVNKFTYDSGNSSAIPDAINGFSTLQHTFDYGVNSGYESEPLYYGGGNYANIYINHGGVGVNNQFNNHFMPVYHAHQFSSDYIANTLTVSFGKYMTSASNYYNSNVDDVQELNWNIIKDMPVITNTDNNSIKNDIITNNNTTNNYNTYTYTTNQGDTITYNVGDYFIIAPTEGLPISYDDWWNIFKVAIDDINLRYDFDTPLTVPTYDEIKYVDMGSFYITPIKQIDKLPLAPDIADTVIDVTDYVDLLGGASTALFSMLDGLGLSLMATFTFLSVLVIRHLKR